MVKGNKSMKKAGGKTTSPGKKHRRGEVKRKKKKLQFFMCARFTYRDASKGTPTAQRSTNRV